MRDRCSDEATAFAREVISGLLDEALLIARDDPTWEEWLCNEMSSCGRVVPAEVKQVPRWMVAGDFSNKSFRDLSYLVVPRTFFLLRHVRGGETKCVRTIHGALKFFFDDDGVRIAHRDLTNSTKVYARTVVMDGGVPPDLTQAMPKSFRKDGDLRSMSGSSRWLIGSVLDTLVLYLDDVGSSLRRVNVETHDWFWESEVALRRLLLRDSRCDPAVLRDHAVVFRERSVTVLEELRCKLGPLQHTNNARALLEYAVSCLAGKAKWPDSSASAQPVVSLISTCVRSDGSREYAPVLATNHLTKIPQLLQELGAASPAQYQSRLIHIFVRPRANGLEAAREDAAACVHYSPRWCVAELGHACVDMPPSGVQPDAEEITASVARLHPSAASIPVMSKAPTFAAM